MKAENLREDDVIHHVVHTTAHAYLLFFTNRGRSIGSRRMRFLARTARPRVYSPNR